MCYAYKPGNFGQHGVGEGAAAADETAEKAADGGGSSRGELDLQLKRVSLKELQQQR